MSFSPWQACDRLLESHPPGMTCCWLECHTEHTTLMNHQQSGPAQQSRTLNYACLSARMEACRIQKGITKHADWGQQPNPKLSTYKPVQPGTFSCAHQGNRETKTDRQTNRCTQPNPGVNDLPKPQPPRNQHEKQQHLAIMQQNKAQPHSFRLVCRLRPQGRRHLVSESEQLMGKARQ